MKESNYNKLPQNSKQESYRFHKPRMSEAVTEYCGTSRLEELVNKCNDTVYRRNQDELRARDQALVATLFLTGGRVSEVLPLKRKNFDFENNEAKKSNAFLVTGMELLKRRTSGGTRRYEARTFPIWYDDPLVEYLMKWVNKLQKPNDYLFPSVKRKNRPLHRKNVHHILSHLGDQLDNPLTINPSWFRFQRQYHLVEERGFSPSIVQVYLQLKNLPTLSSSRKDWENLLAISRPLKEEKMYEKAPYDALRDIQKLLKSAKKQVMIIDPYVDDVIFELYLDYINPNVSIKIITQNMYKNFKEVAKRFKLQKPTFTVRSTTDIHDRYLVIDDRVFVTGSSLNRAGMKPLYLIELNDKFNIFKWFQKLWNSGKIEF